MNSERDAAARAKDRLHWPVRVHRLGEEPSESLLESTTAEERLAMMWPLAMEAWSLAGRLEPALPRSKLPVLTAVEFEDAWTKRAVHRVGQMVVQFLGRESLIQSKRAVDRSKDRVDLDLLEGRA
ncbi:MAG: hypothetical protein ACT4PE_12045 [Candidatus Eiseniibacteriota bacterium]